MGPWHTTKHSNDSENMGMGNTYGEFVTVALGTDRG